MVDLLQTIEDEIIIYSDDLSFEYKKLHTKLGELTLIEFKNLCSEFKKSFTVYFTITNSEKLYGEMINTGFITYYDINYEFTISIHKVYPYDKKFIIAVNNINKTFYFNCLKHQLISRLNLNEQVKKAVQRKIVTYQKYKVVLNKKKGFYL